MINLFYNYYTKKEKNRQLEIDSCFFMNLNDQNIERIFLYVSLEDLDILNRKLDILGYSSDKVEAIVSEVRPTFSDAAFGVMNRFCGIEDINILINSDCFFAEYTDWDFVREMDNNERFSLSRYDISGINPIMLKNPLETLRKNIETIKPSRGSQDCWIFKGRLNIGLNLDFKFGVPGCDNRIGYEFSRFNFRVRNVISKIKVLHLHISGNRYYSKADKVLGRYRSIPIE